MHSSQSLKILKLNSNQNLLMDNPQRQQKQQYFLLYQVLKLPDRLIQLIEEFEDMNILY